MTELDRFAALVTRHLGLVFEGEQRGVLAAVLGRRAARTGVALYLARLEKADLRDLRLLAQDLTVTETSFFRDSGQMQAFAQTALAERIAARGAARNLRLLSAGCASGEELHSLAILVRETPQLAGWDIRLQGLDANPAMLKKARAGRYSAWSLRQVTPQVRARWFRTAGQDFLLDDAIRAMAEFSEHNLSRDGAVWQPESYDIVFCRNVLMYFSPCAARAAVARIARSGEEALELLAAQSVDCVLLDLQMPGIGGREACRRIKAAPALRGIPVIILTAQEDRAAMIEGLSTGADDYITKAGDFAVLRARILAQIRRKQFEDENRFIRERLARQELEAVATRSARALDEMQAVMAERKRAEDKMNRLQAELTHVSRWNVMGMMAASLAHELNQPLTAVKNYVSAARRVLDGLEGPTVPRAREMMDKAAGQAMQAGAIIRNLRDFIEKKEVNRAAQEINTVVEEAVALGLVGAASRDIKVRLELAPGLGAVFINKIQVQQVLVNLFRNAAEAMAGRERRDLTVATGPDEPGFVGVAVSDTGPGIAPEMMARLFQPFSTSKQEGMGIGLKICQSIIEAHDGRIWLTPNDGGGVTFRFRLPVAEAVEMLEAQRG